MKYLIVGTKYFKPLREARPTADGRIYCDDGRLQYIQSPAEVIDADPAEMIRAIGNLYRRRGA
jgi:hypothetical protein